MRRGYGIGSKGSRLSWAPAPPPAPHCWPHAMHVHPGWSPFACCRRGSLLHPKQCAAVAQSGAFVLQDSRERSNFDFVFEFDGQAVVRSAWKPRQSGEKSRRTFRCSWGSGVQVAPEIRPNRAVVRKIWALARRHVGANLQQVQHSPHSSDRPQSRCYVQPAPSTTSYDGSLIGRCAALKIWSVLKVGSSRLPPTCLFLRWTI
jgi:hypothetical protein